VDATRDPARPAASVVDARIALRQLMVAVLQDALRTFQHGRPALAAEVDIWLRARDRRWPFAFLVVCETLGLDPGAVERAARQRRAGTERTRRRIRGNVRRVAQLGADARRSRCGAGSQTPPHRRTPC